MFRCEHRCWWTKVKSRNRPHTRNQLVLRKVPQPLHGERKAPSPAMLSRMWSDDKLCPAWVHTGVWTWILYVDLRANDAEFPGRGNTCYLPFPGETGRLFTPGRALAPDQTIDSTQVWLSEPWIYRDYRSMGEISNSVKLLLDMCPYPRERITGVCEDLCGCLQPPFIAAEPGEIPGVGQQKQSKQRRAWTVKVEFRSTQHCLAS